jgi:hypothetical protein
MEADPLNALRVKLDQLELAVRKRVTSKPVLGSGWQEPSRLPNDSRFGNKGRVGVQPSNSLLTLLSRILRGRR